METLTIKLEKTCHACPEQYDMFINEERVGYLRLRHGRFTVTYPDVGGELLLDLHPRGDGVFYEEERSHYLMQAIRAVLDKIGFKKLGETFQDREWEYYAGPEKKDD